MSPLHNSCLIVCLLGLGCATNDRDTLQASSPSGATDSTGASGGAAGASGGNHASSGSSTSGGPGASQTDGDPGDGGSTGGTDAAGSGATSGGQRDGGTTPPIWTGSPALGATCGGVVKPGVTGAVPSFARQTVSTQAGAAYLHPADLDADGFPELLLTSLSEGVDVFGGLPPLDFGGAYVLRRNGGPPQGTLGDWGVQKAFDKRDKIGCPNASELFDVDGDGVDDWVIGAGFLIEPSSKIVWLKGSAAGTFGKVQLIPVPDRTCWYHITLGLDMDGDQDNDFVTSCHVGDTRNPSSGPSRVQWFENDGKGNFTSHPIGDGGGSLVSLYDLDADGDQDVIAPQIFGPESMVWYEQTGTKGTAWVEHIIDNSSGRGFIVKFADMNGDGKRDMLYGNHNNEEAPDPAGKLMGVYWFDLPPPALVAGLGNWDAFKHTVYEGFQVDGTGNAASGGAPGMLHVGDVDGDCDMDVTVSGDGDLGLYVLLQQADRFQKVELYRHPTNANSGEQHLIDLDRDGDQDIVWAVFGPSGAAFSLDSHVYAFLQQ